MSLGYRKRDYKAATQGAREGGAAAASDDAEGDDGCVDDGTDLDLWAAAWETREALLAHVRSQGLPLLEACTMERFFAYLAWHGARSGGAKGGGQS